MALLFCFCRHGPKLIQQTPHLVQRSPKSFSAPKSQRTFASSIRHNSLKTKTIMKKLMIALMMVAATSTASFAKADNNDKVQTAAKEVAQKVKDAPSGTTYGIVEITKDHVVVNTPLGSHTINKNADGSFTFMGVTAKLVSARNGVYKVKTSFGTFDVNTRKATITKK